MLLLSISLSFPRSLFLSLCKRHKASSLLINVLGTLVLQNCSNWPNRRHLCAGEWLHSRSWMALKKSGGWGPGWSPCTGGPGTQSGRCALLHWSHSESCALGSPPIETRGNKVGLVTAQRCVSEQEKPLHYCVWLNCKQSACQATWNVAQEHNSRQEDCMIYQAWRETKWLLINMWSHGECGAAWGRHSPGRPPEWPLGCSWSWGECPVATGRSQSGTVCSW